MPRQLAKNQDAYLHDMLEAAELIDRYMKGVSVEQFWHNGEKRDAVALRLSILGESAHKVDTATESALPKIPFGAIRGMRNRVVHDCGAFDFRIVWMVTREEIKPLKTALRAHFARKK
jgi:uncharacterized protein with HEPN domain